MDEIKASIIELYSGNNNEPPHCLSARAGRLCLLGIMIWLIGEGDI